MALPRDEVSAGLIAELADDICSALGEPSVPGDGLRAAASHFSVELSKRGWGPATLDLDASVNVSA